MEMPKPGAAHKRLEKLVGTWTGTEVMHPSPWAPEGSTSEARSEFRLALGGFALIRDYEQRRDGRTTFSGHGVYTWDADEECYVLHWFDSMGMAPEVFRGDFEEDVLTLVSRASSGESARRTRGTLDVREAGKMTSRLALSKDGESWEVLMDGEYTRAD